MAKNSKVFFCTNCGYESAKWEGRCPACGEWNTFSEEQVVSFSKKTTKALSDNPPVALKDIKSEDTLRIVTGIGELDRVLGGGIVPGSLILLGGDPGIGKSTLLLQLCSVLRGAASPVLYISGEESKGQIKMRADRMGDFPDNVMILAETDTDLIKSVVEKTKPYLVIIDSIQTMYSPENGSPPGSVTQVREATNTFMHLAKQNNIPIFVVGHVTKEGMVAGPKMLEHMVDTVLYFEGDKSATYRVLRGVKNRFGSTNEIGVFEMTGTGLNEVSNPSEYMLSEKPLDASGSVVTCTMEGTRPILLEVQALVTKSNFGMPRRSASGLDKQRVDLLIAVLEKRLNLPLGEFDAFVNVAGGMKIREPAIDLGVVLAVLSSYKNKVIDSSIVCFGEVGLNGEIRNVTQSLSRIKEAEKLGFTSCIIPKNAIKPDMIKGSKIKIHGVENVNEALKLI